MIVSKQCTFWMPERLDAEFNKFTSKYYRGDRSAALRSLIKQACRELHFDENIDIEKLNKELRIGLYGPLAKLPPPKLHPGNAADNDTGPR